MSFNPPHEFTGCASSPTMIWGHGLTQSRRLEDVAPIIAWSQIPARVIRYDARGHGEADSTPDLSDYTWAALAQDQLNLADSLGVDRYIAGGASMGCGTALHAAVSAPQRIQALVLVIPPTAWETRAEQAGQWQAGADLVARDGVEPFIAGSARRPIPGPFLEDPDYQDRRAQGLRSWETDRLVRVLRGATGADLPSRDAIRAIDCPALILAWTGDPAHPESTADELAQLLPQAHLHTAATAADLGCWTDELSAFVSALTS